MRDYRRAGAVLTAAALLAFFTAAAGAAIQAAPETGKIQRLAAAFNAAEETETKIPEEETQLPDELKEEAPEGEYRPEEEDVFSGWFRTDELEDGTLEILEGSPSAMPPDGTLKIPEEIDGKKVTAIAEGAFAGCSFFDSVHIPASVRRIGEGAFEGCPVRTLTGESNENWQVEDGVLYSNDGVLLWYPQKRPGSTYQIRKGTKRIAGGAFKNCRTLRSVTLTEGLARIGSSAFEGCRNLAQLSLPASLEDIGEGAFAGSGITAFSVPEGHRYYSVRDGVLLSEKEKVLTAYPSGAARTYYQIPESVTIIAPGAFAGCSSLWRVILPDSLTVIGKKAFREAAALRSIRIPSNVIFIGEGAFMNCPLLELVRWEALTDLVARDMFRGCEKLQKISLPMWTRSVDEGAFADCPALSDVRLGSGLEHLGAYVFDGCPSLKMLTLPADLLDIDEQALGDPRTQKIVLKVAKGSYSEIWARKRGFSRHAMPLTKFERYVQKTEPSGWEKLNEEQKQKQYENPEIIRQVQIILNGAGLNCGKADGVLGAKTRSAIRTFREERFMADGEEIDETLLRSMGIEPVVEAAGTAGNER